MKTGFIASSFDLLHAGHIYTLKQCKEHCDYLIVALQSDPTIDRENKNKPIQGLYERWVQLNAVDCVDKIIPYDSEDDLLNMLVTMSPDIRFLGSDYRDNEDYTGYGLPFDIEFIDREHNWSSSGLRERIKNGRK